MFESLSISYTPPATIPAPLRAVTSAAAATTPANSMLSGAQIRTPQTTVAGQLRAQLAALADCAAYLEGLIKARAAGSGIQFAASGSPDLAQALGNLYPGTDVPGGISVEMYANMLDAELGLAQVQSALGPDAAIEASSQNIADLITTTKAFEKAMIGSGDFQNNLTPLLRSLKGDQVIYANLQEQIAEYPAYAGTDSMVSSGLDVSPAVEGLFGNYMDAQATVYSRMFSILTTASDVENDILGVASLFMGTSGGELGTYLATLRSLQQSSHQVKLQDLSDDATNFVFVSLISDLSGAANEMDRLFNLAVLPMKMSTSDAAGMLRQMQAVSAAIGKTSTGGLRGAIAGNPCMATSSQATVSTIPTSSGNKTLDTIQRALEVGLGSASKGVLSVLNHLDLATSTVDKKNKAIQDSLRRVLARRTADQSDRLDLLCSLKNLEAVLNLILGLIAVTQTKAVGSTQTTALQSITQVISSFASPTGTSFSMQNGAVLVTPPSVPAVPETVQTVLNRGGAGLVSSRDLSTPSS